MKKEEELYSLAKEFHNYIENNTISKDIVDTLIIKLMKIYMLALELPEVRPDTKIDYYREIPRIKIKIDDDVTNRYWLVFNSYKKDDLVSNTIEDDLDDIVHDLDKGIVEYEDKNINNAIFIWKTDFLSHWGFHVVELLKVLHTIKEQNYILGGTHEK